MTQLATARSILLVSQPTSAGTARHVRDLAVGMGGRGWAVHVACPDEGSLPARLRDSGIGFQPLPMRREIRPLADITAFVRLVRMCRRLRPDVLHLHSSKAGFLGRVAGRVAGVPVVAFTPHCWSFQSATGRKRRFYIVLERLASAFCDVTIAVSQREADEAVALGVVRRDRIRVIHNGLSMAALAPAGVTPDGGRFVSVGRLDEQKGYRYLLEGMALLLRTDRDARLSIVGDGTQRPELERLAARLGIQDAVRFEGQQATVTRYLDASRVFVLSSLWEGLPYTILEAMAAGLPVISTDVGGCGELVQDGETGLLVPARDSRALADAMRTLWRDVALRTRMGVAGRRRVAEFFRLSSCVAGNEDAYLEVIGRRRDVADDARRGALLGRGTAIAMATLVVLVAGLAAADEIAYRGKVLPGVHVGAADVGGLTLQDAATKLDHLAGSPVAVAVPGIPDVTLASTLEPDIQSAISRAYLVGRVGSFPARFAARLAADRGGVSLPLPVARTAEVERVLDAAKSALDRPAQEARYAISADRVVVVGGRPGRRIDARRTLEMLGVALTSASPGGRRVTVPLVATPPSVTSTDAARFLRIAARWTQGPVTGLLARRRIVLSRSQVASLLRVHGDTLVVSPAALSDTLSSSRIPSTPSRDARLVVSGGAVRIVAGASGTRLDAAASARSLQTALAKGGARFEVAMQAVEPQVTARDLRALGIKRRLATCTTRFRLGMDARDANISLAAAAVRGAVLGIGEVFSLNQRTGPRGPSAGYREALVFLGGKVVPGVGGGVCQVSSTLYDAALLAGFRIVERRSHSMAVSYLPPGLDATTYYPTIDLKFQNTSRGPVLLWSEVRGDRLTMSVWGSGARPSIRLETKLKKTTKPKDKVAYSTTLPHNGRVVEVIGTPGYVVSSYRLTYQGGRLQRRELLATDEYRPKDGLIRVGR